MHYNYPAGIHEGFFGMGRYFGWGGGYIGTALILVALAVLLIVVFRKNRSGGIRKGASALERLQERFVAGEISKEEFLEKKDILGQK